MDRALDSGSKGWGFESLLAYHVKWVSEYFIVLGNFFSYGATDNATKNSSLVARISGKGQSQSDMPPACPLCLYFWRTLRGSKVSPTDGVFTRSYRQFAFAQWHRVSCV